MCFSAQADVAGGLVAGIIGIDAWRHARYRSERMLASLPILLGVHELIEAFVWWGLAGQVPWSIGGAAVWVYLVIAFVVVPVLVPAAVMAVEPDSTRRKLMIIFVGMGVVVAVIYLVAIITRPVSAEIDGHTIVYFNHLGESTAANALYVMAACGVLLASSHRHIVLFGLANVAAVAVLLWLSSRANTSLWCAWAAVTSFAIAAHLRVAHRAGARRSAAPGQFA